MSPPVVGTLLGLLIAYVLPAEEGSWMPLQMEHDYENSKGSYVPLKIDEYLEKVMNRPANSQTPGSSIPQQVGSNDKEWIPQSASKNVKVKQEKAEKRDLSLFERGHHARIPVGQGLAGVSMAQPGLLELCHQRKGSFVKDEPCYEWKVHEGKILWFHERCILNFSEAEGAQRQTIHRVEKLISNTRSIPCLCSLYACQDDLWAENPFPLDDPDEADQPDVPAPSGANDHAVDSQDASDARDFKVRRIMGAS